MSAIEKETEPIYLHGGFLTGKRGLRNSVMNSVGLPNFLLLKEHI
jgi:hypothetical protein